MMRQNIFSTTTIAGLVVDVGPLPDAKGEWCILHIPRQEAKSILRYAWEKTAKFENRTINRRYIGRQIDKQMKKIRMPPSYLGGVIVGRTGTDGRNQIQFFDRYFDEHGAIKCTRPVMVYGDLPELRSTCAGCGRYAPYLCLTCNFHYCSNFCLLAYPHRHHVPCPKFTPKIHQEMFLLLEEKAKEKIKQVSREEKKLQVPAAYPNMVRDDSSDFAVLQPGGEIWKPDETDEKQIQTSAQKILEQLATEHFSHPVEAKETYLDRIRAIAHTPWEPQVESLLHPPSSLPARRTPTETLQHMHHEISSGQIRDMRMRYHRIMWMMKNFHRENATWAAMIGMHYLKWLHVALEIVAEMMQPEIRKPWELRSIVAFNLNPLMRSAYLTKSFVKPYSSVLGYNTWLSNFAPWTKESMNCDASSWSLEQSLRILAHHHELMVEIRQSARKSPPPAGMEKKVDKSSLT